MEYFAGFISMLPPYSKFVTFSVNLLHCIVQLLYRPDFADNTELAFVYIGNFKKLVRGEIISAISRLTLAFIPQLKPWVFSLTNL